MLQMLWLRSSMPISTHWSLKIHKKCITLPNDSDFLSIKATPTRLLIIATNPVPIRY